MTILVALYMYTGMQQLVKWRAGDGPWWQPGFSLLVWGSQVSKGGGQNGSCGNGSKLICRNIYSFIYMHGWHGHILLLHDQLRAYKKTHPVAMNTPGAQILVSDTILFTKKLGLALTPTIVAYL